MKITELLNARNIKLGVSATSKQDVLEKAVKLMVSTGAIIDAKTYEQGVFARETESTTGVGDGIAIPHCKSKAVSEPMLVAMTIPEGVDYDSLDGEKVNLLFLIAAPYTNSNIHLEVLAKLSNILMHPEYVFALKKAKSTATFLNILDYAEATIDLEKSRNVLSDYPRILAATACPTGIAHTYMAQEALEKTAKEMGISIKVETNGTGGVKNALTEEEIEHAETIIVAADAFVEMERFVGKRVFQCAVSKAIHNPKQIIEQSLDPITPIYGKGRENLKQDKTKENVGGGKFHTFYKHLMSGISHMIPFVVAGGILLAIAYLIDGICQSPKAGVDIWDATHTVIIGHTDFGNISPGAKIFHMLGGDLGLGLMLPVLGGFIAYSIAGKPGLVSGFIASFACTKGQWSLLYWVCKANGSEKWAGMLEGSAAGFLGAIAAGFLAGYTVLFLKKKFEKLPRTLEGVKDMLFVPLLSTAFVAFSMMIINIPLAFVNIGINKGIMALSDVGAVIAVAALVSGLMATDMGGPINKAAHYATLAILQQAIAKGDPGFQAVAEKLLCANIVGIMTPPIGIAIATWLFPQKFSKGDRNPSIANCVTGVCGITEGAIPYVTKDPIRVLISTVTGAAAGGMISFAFGGRAIAPEGGTISMMVMGGICWAGLLATLIGSVITALILGFLKKDVDPELSELKKWKGIPTQPVYNAFAKVGNFISKPFKKDKK